MVVDHAAFHDQILARLDDDGPRAVYGDALQEAGDPRGELIVLSLLEARAGANAKQKRRIQELVRTHAEAWFGDLPRLCKQLRFERGFLGELSFKGGLERLDAADIARALDNPELRFVEKIHYANATSAYRRLRLAPYFESVRDVFLPKDDVDGAVEIALDRRPRGWRMLYASAVMTDEAVFDAVADSPSLRAVERLSIPVWPDDLAALVAHARRRGWPTRASLRSVHLELGAGFGSGAERSARLLAMGAPELANEVTWATPYGERGRE